MKFLGSLVVFRFLIIAGILASLVSFPMSWVPFLVFPILIPMSPTPFLMSPIGFLGVLILVLGS